MQMTRAVIVLRSTFVLIGCGLVGCLLMKLGWVIETELSFHRLFLSSMAVALGPVCFYLLHLSVTLIYRLYKSTLLFYETMQLRHGRLQFSQKKR